METLEVRYVKKDLLKGNCTYKTSDYYIEFIPEKVNSLNLSNEFYIIIDTITITTIGEDKKEFYSIDAYTNSEIWNIDNSIIGPIQYNTGTIIFNKILQDDDRISVNITPKYYYNKSKNILSIKLSEEKSSLFIKVSDCLFFGLYRGNLNEIILFINFV